MGSKGKKLRRMIRSTRDAAMPVEPTTEAERLAVHDEVYSLGPNESIVTEATGVFAPEAVDLDVTSDVLTVAGAMEGSLEAMAKESSDHAPNAIGWTFELSKFVNTTMAAKAMAERVLEMVNEIDKGSAYLVAALGALAAGDFVLAHLNFFNCGMTETGPSVVEEVEVD